MSKTREQRRREKYDSTRGLMLSLVGFAVLIGCLWMTLIRALALSAL